LEKETFVRADSFQTILSLSPYQNRELVDLSDTDVLPQVFLEGSASCHGIALWMDYNMGADDALKLSTRWTPGEPGAW
jgi:hypothetical protein